MSFGHIIESYTITTTENKMNIETTNFEHEHESSEIKNSLGDDYVYHNITVHNEMKINNETVAIYYQAGHTYYHGSHGSPSNELSFYKSNNNQIDSF